MCRKLDGLLSTRRGAETGVASVPLKIDPRHGMSGHKLCRAQLPARLYVEKRHTLGREGTDAGFCLTAPTNWMCEPGQTI